MESLFTPCLLYTFSSTKNLFDNTFRVSAVPKDYKVAQ